MKDGANSKQVNSRVTKELENLQRKEAPKPVKKASPTPVRASPEKKSDSTSNSELSSRKHEIIKKKTATKKVNSPMMRSCSTMESVSLNDGIPDVTEVDPTKPGDDKIGELLKAFAKKCNKFSVADLYKMYNSLPDPTKDECRLYLDARNSTRNRYSNVYCLDKTRVELRFLAEEGFTKYIHANWVTHNTLAQPFIITQVR